MPPTSAAVTTVAHALVRFEMYRNLEAKSDRTFWRDKSNRARGPRATEAAPKTRRDPGAGSGGECPTENRKALLTMIGIYIVTENMTIEQRAKGHARLQEAPGASTSAADDIGTSLDDVANVLLDQLAGRAR